MILKHLEGMSNYFKRLQAELATDILMPKKGLAKIKLTTTGEFLEVISNGEVFSVKLKQKNKMQEIADNLQRGYANLAEITNVSKNTDLIELCVVFFSGDELDLGDLSINITQQVIDRADKLRLGNNLTQLFSDSVLLKGNIINDDERYIPILVGSANADNWGNEEISVDTGFTIFGNGLQLKIEPIKQKQKNLILSVKQLRLAHSKALIGPIRLVRVNLKFVNQEEELQNFASSQMTQILSDSESPSYFNVWDKYGEFEGELLLERARKVGILPIASVEPTASNIKVYFDGVLPKELTDRDQLEIILANHSPPIYLTEPKLTWMQYSDLLFNKFKTAKKNSKSSEPDTEKAILELKGEVVTIVKKGKNYLVLDINQPLTANRHAVILSINGDKIQMQRRMLARELIISGRAANQQLGLVIAEGGEIKALKKGKELKALTPEVVEKVFPKNPPTAVQEQAIKIALNTPDIALIQGPPGTGKTTVILGILERLNQELEKTDDYRGKILVSGFQHDAVENLLARLSINAIPSIKFGKKSGTDYSLDRIDKKITKWCDDLAEKIRSKNPELAPSETLKNLRKALGIYQQQPNDALAANQLRELQKLPEINKDSNLSKKIRLLLQEFAPTEINRKDYFLQLIYGLRCQPNSFLDDGVDRAMALYEALQDQLDKESQALLRKAATWQQGKELDFLPKLQKLRRSLLMRFRPKQHFRVAKPRKDVQQVLIEAIAILENSQKYVNGLNSALVDFLFELEHNQEEIKQSMAEYNLVVGATVQQSQGKDIREYKKASALNHKNHNIARLQELAEISPDLLMQYDTVIIDEAARCSPRDLLIPLVQAKKRIILVGDHRQLPHIVDEAVTQKLEEGEQQQTEESMFEYLFRRLKVLEQQDGIQRTITLDAQFRTHPLLGEFASKHFYEIHDPCEAYRSPLTAKFFQHHLLGVDDQAAIWLNVPHELGPEERNSARSRYRESEAKAIAKQLAQWIDSETGKKLSFGVISFYKAQVFKVFEALSEYGITRKEQGNWVFTEEYHFLENGEERIRIGTVDSFQGMEFDIVFLSQVRTASDKELGKSLIDDQKAQSRLFGHLMSSNRLCVSMTRQKKLLVLSGDANLANQPITQQAVPGLYHFYQLCLNQGMVLDAK